jgi:hypothetical protein
MKIPRGGRASGKVEAAMSDPHASIFAEPAGAEPVAEGEFGFVKPEHADFPPILIIAVTNLCDMACIHCAHPVMKKAPGYRGVFMDPEIHTKIVEETRRFRDRLWVFRYAISPRTRCRSPTRRCAGCCSRPST